jgi:hypothetical protein
MHVAEYGPFCPDDMLEVHWERRSDIMRVTIPREGAAIPEAGIRTPDGILTLDYVARITMNPELAGTLPPEYVSEG